MATIAALLLVACSAGGGAATQSPRATTAASNAPSVSAAPSVTATATASAAPSAPASVAVVPSDVPSATPILDPDLCPATTGTPAHVTDDGTAIDGDAAFVDHVLTALDLLRDTAPESYAFVVENVSMIRQVPSYSGMCYDTGTYRVGAETAYAPGHPLASQVIWLAGTIVHDACHRDRFVDGLVPGGRDGELDCLEHQVEALRTIGEGTTFAAYVQNLIDTVDDPASQYWTVENRHW